MCRVLSVNSGSAASSASQAWVNSARSASRHWVLARSAIVDRGMLHRAHQADAALDRAVVQHQARRRHLHGGPPGLAVHQQPRTGLAIRHVQRLGQREWLVALAPQDGEHLRLGAALRMRVDRFAAGDGQALGRHGLDAEIIGAGRNRALDAGAQKVLEHLEQGVLQRDGQRQQPVEEGRDRRQVFAQSCRPGRSAAARSRPRRF